LIRTTGNPSKQKMKMKMDETKLNVEPVKRRDKCESQLGKSLRMNTMGNQ